MSNEKKGTKKSLKLKRRHPNNKIRLGRHLITAVKTDFYLNKKELEELESLGCQHWIDDKE